MNFKNELKYLLKKYFPDIIYYFLKKRNLYLTERIKIFEHLKIDTLLDVGANIGLYGHCVRNTGFKGKIISFEPQSDAFTYLSKLSADDDKWLALNFALGAENKTSEINISENSVSSSILSISSNLENLVPSTRYIQKEKIEIKRLDSIIKDYCTNDEKIFVKIDTQGFEKEVIDGCKNCMERISGFQLELSFQELYPGEITFLEMINKMDSLEYALVKIESGWNDINTGFAVEVDGIFIKKSLINNNNL